MIVQWPCGSRVAGDLHRDKAFLTLASHKRRVLLAERKVLQEKALAIENDVRGLRATSA
jgi:hypothetical protein